MNGGEDRQGTAGKVKAGEKKAGDPGAGGRKGSAQAGLILRPLLESLSGGEFIVTVLLGKGEDDAGGT